MDSVQIIQEEEYHFPYHHIPSWKPFTQSRSLWWGYEYAAYIEYLISVILELQPQSLIDVGCGDGKLLFELSLKDENIKLHGTDFSEKALGFARAFTGTRVSFTNDVPGNKEYDMWTAIEVFEHIPVDEADAFLKTLGNSVKTGGVGILTVPHTNVPLNPKHYRHFTETTLRESLEHHFEIEKIVHLNGNTWQSRIIRRLLANRLFILNWQPAKEYLYTRYKKTSLQATESNATRLLAVVRMR